MLMLVWLHFIADFLLQDDTMARNKSKSILWLGGHALIYMTPFLYLGWEFVVFTGATHFITDFFTSKGTTWLWLRGERRWFFVLIGFDQAIHISTLVLTTHLLALQVY